MPISDDWSSYDFVECLNHRDHSVRAEQVERVLLARGVGNRGYADWTGDFIVLLKDGRFAVLSGWSDSTGWG